MSHINRPDLIQKQSNYKYAAILEISGNSKENTVKEGFHY